MASTLDWKWLANASAVWAVVDVGAFGASKSALMLAGNFQGTPFLLRLSAC